MKLKSTPFLAGAFLFLASCNSEETTKPTIPASTDKVAIIQHPVADYARWRPFFDADDSARKVFGLTAIGVGKGIDDPNQLIIYLKMEDTARANAFRNRPELKAAMDSGGVTGPPSFDYVNTVRNDTSNTDIKDRILVIHKVKDFDVWLKAFDDEGMETRKTFGLVDRALARGMDDPNMVYILFAVSDWDKANARMSSDELKKIMTDAGVEGAPTFVKYTLQ
jgi:hypothetical protein